jgi:hypothetical protein
MGHLSNSSRFNEEERRPVNTNLQILVRAAVADVEVEGEGLSAIGVTSSRGWGDIGSVAIEVASNGRTDHDDAEVMLRDAVAAVIPGTRHRVTHQLVCEGLSPVELVMRRSVGRQLSQSSD